MSKIKSIFKAELGVRVIFDSPRIRYPGEDIDTVLNSRVRGAPGRKMVSER